MAGTKVTGKRQAEKGAGSPMKKKSRRKDAPVAVRSTPSPLGVLAERLKTQKLEDIMAETPAETPATSKGVIVISPGSATLRIGLVAVGTDAYKKAEAGVLDLPQPHSCPNILAWKRKGDVTRALPASEQLLLSVGHCPVSLIAPLSC